MHPRSLPDLGLAVALLGGAACRAPDVRPRGRPRRDASGSSELIGPVVDPNVVALAPAPAPTPAPAPAAARARARRGLERRAHRLAAVRGRVSARAKAQKKPVCLVLYTGWCPHCRNYSHVFEDPQVVERAKDFVMIRANADDEPAVASKFVPDGGYVPRTFFLSPDGTLDPEIHAARPKFLYFYDERAPHSLLAGMAQAKAKLAK